MPVVACGALLGFCKCVKTIAEMVGLSWLVAQLCKAKTVVKMCAVLVQVPLPDSVYKDVILFHKQLCMQGKICGVT